MNSFEVELRNTIQGEVRFDLISKEIYSVDASIYEIEPIGIVLPKHREDIINAIQIASKHKIPIIARGAATGITGGCIGRGLIIDTSKYLTNILEINYEDKYAICEPGVVQDSLNAALASKGCRLGPDTSTGNRATLGGMLANNAAGARSLHYGKMVDHVEEVEMVLATGEIIHFTAISELTFENKILNNGLEGEIYRFIDRLRKEYREEVEKKFPHLPRRVSGYNLDELIKPFPLNVSKVVVGSEGTLGVVTKLKVKICKCPRVTGLVAVHFHSILEGMHAIEKMLTFQPLSLEMIDANIIEMGIQSPSTRKKLQWLIGNPQAVFVAEFEGSSIEEVREKLDTFKENMTIESIGYAYTQLTSPKEMNNIWDVRKAGLGLLLSKRTYLRAIAFIEDISVPPEKLDVFMHKFLTYLKEVGKEAGIYGHVGSGCIHIRPYMDLRHPEDLELMKNMMLQISDLLLESNGALSGEHGDGLIRSWLNKKMFGDRLYEAFVELKKVFDPENMMNPGKIVHGASFLKDLRMNSETKMISLDTFLDFSGEGGFQLAVDLCNGNGLCRKSEGIMCPSFQVTGDEYDSTRARAQALRSVVNGKRPLEEFTNEGILQVLDLCLECKGCKTECPSQVDTAKIKSEFLYQYQEKNGYFFRNRLFGNIGLLNKSASPLAAFFNKFSGSKLSKTILGWVGITSERNLPPLAKETFSAWVNKQCRKENKKKVVLFNDTYTQFNYPEIGQAAYKILTALNYEVIIPKWHCCGRPEISKGLLKQAQRKAIKLINILYPFAIQKIPIIGLEPSCILTIKDDFKGLIGKAYPEFVLKMSLIEKMCLTLDEFLEFQIVDNELPLPFLKENKKVMVHTHCHQKSLVGIQPTLNVLQSIPGLEVSHIDSGCCGLAGSFGYEKEHYAFSMQIGELKLFPAIRKSNAEVLFIANGLSCRSQISHGTGRNAVHLAEAVNSFLL
jgi:FAD/FMN-containing dehydrogenase/Fe-S oxidoreductase